MPIVDILRPVEAIENYKNQIKHTIDAYSVPHIVVGEALQNALDAIAQRTEAGDRALGKILIDINFDTSTVIVSDNGAGFPNDSRLLILGGSAKPKSSKTVSGMVGVGIKVVMYCSNRFTIQAKTATEKWRLDVQNACKFQEDANLKLELPVPFNADPAPLAQTGTRLTYVFPPPTDDNVGRLRQFMDAVRSRLVDPELGEAGGFPNLISTAVPDATAVQLLRYYLLRFAYAGDTLRHLGGRPGLGNTEITLRLTASNPVTQLDTFWSTRWGGNPTISATFKPGYLDVIDTVPLVRIRKPGLYENALGNGGQGLDLTARGFNTLTFIDQDGYKKLLMNSQGALPAAEDMDRYVRRLFPLINCIRLTIGRIPLFNEHLPHGTRRVLSANGVITEHDIEITSGRNQQYVRCVDLLIDLDAQLNYGKTQITNMALVGLVRDFVNEAYRRTLQNAAARFVGKVAESDDDTPADVFWTRDNLVGFPDLPFIKVPKDENDVIALFSALVSSRKLSGYSIYGLSQVDQYDSRMVIKRECDRADLLTAPIETDLRTVEFKQLASFVIKDFEAGIKDPKDIHLVIAWDVGAVNSAQFTIEAIENSAAYRASPKKVFPGVKYFISDNRGGKELQLLILRPLATT